MDPGYVTFWNTSSVAIRSLCSRRHSGKSFENVIKIGLYQSSVDTGYTIFATDKP